MLCACLALLWKEAAMGSGCRPRSSAALQMIRWCSPQGELCGQAESMAGNNTVAVPPGSKKRQRTAPQALQPCLEQQHGVLVQPSYLTPPRTRPQGWDPGQTLQLSCFTRSAGTGPDPLPSLLSWSLILEDTDIPCQCHGVKYVHGWPRKGLDYLPGHFWPE